MTRFAVPAIVVGIVVAVLGIVSILLGFGLLPTPSEAVERGTAGDEVREPDRVSVALSRTFEDGSRAPPVARELGHDLGGDGALGVVETPCIVETIPGNVGGHDRNRPQRREDKEYAYSFHTTT